MYLFIIPLFFHACILIRFPLFSHGTLQHVQYVNVAIIVEQLLAESPELLFNCRIYTWKGYTPDYKAKMI